MEALWFWLVAWLLTTYVVLDGFDLGAGVAHLWVARSDEERRLVIRSIGPVWDGNEVWLIAAGVTLYFAFPALYASSFSGFYLPLMIVLWLIILRGISIELRGHIDSPVWKPFWDAGFAISSGLLAIFFGAALGNVIRGVPLDETGRFFLPLWTDFNLSREVGILDWYTVLVGLLAVLTLTMHGALWVALKTEGNLQARSRRLASTAWCGVAAMTVLVTVFTMRIQPKVWENFTTYPWGFLIPSLAVAGLAAAFVYTRSGDDLRAFLASCGFIVGIMSSAAFGIFPYVLPSNADPELGLTAYNVATSAYGLRVGLIWWIPGMILALGYFSFTYRHFAGKVRLDEEGY